MHHFTTVCLRGSDGLDQSRYQSNRTAGIFRHRAGLSIAMSFEFEFRMAETGAGGDEGRY